MAKKQKENYLERIPVIKDKFRFTENDEGLVTIEIDNKGLFNRLLQLIAKKPKVSYIHLDENGSFIWPLIDGERDIIEIGKLVEAHFGEKANPLYERLVKFFQILENYSFVQWK